MHKSLLTLLVASALVGCGSGAPEGPGPESIGEKRALEDAAEMLTQQRTPVVAPSSVPKR